MDRASTSPAPWPGTLAPRDALARVNARIPGLDEVSARALALVELAARPRSAAAPELGLSGVQLATRLAAARRALRRTVVELPGAGWCERVERLLSDRIDGALGTAGERRLHVHLESCERCAHHERALADAREQLGAAPLALLPARVPTRPAPPPAQAAPRPPAKLRLVEPDSVVAAEPPAPPAPAQAPPAAPPLAAPPVIAVPVGPVAGPLEPPVRTRRDVAVDTSWHTLFALAVLLAVAAIFLTVAGATGLLERL
ncbi:MAG: zf-HC2 domain-containing protein [Thermoleophilaceae bacterium]